MTLSKAERTKRSNLALSKRRRIRRAKWIADHGPCAQCGSSDRLEVDHIDWRTKGINHSAGSTLWGWSQAKRDIELIKCQVLCHECHRTKSKVDLSERRLKPIHHGTEWAYDGRKCRCVTCVTFKKERVKCRKKR